MTAQASVEDHQRELQRLGSTMRALATDQIELKNDLSVKAARREKGSPSSASHGASANIFVVSDKLQQTVDRIGKVEQRLELLGQPAVLERLQHAMEWAAKVELLGNGRPGALETSAADGSGRAAREAARGATTAAPPDVSRAAGGSAVHGLKAPFEKAAPSKDEASAVRRADSASPAVGLHTSVAAENIPVLDEPTADVGRWGKVETPQRLSAIASTTPGLHDPASSATLSVRAGSIALRALRHDHDRLGSQYAVSAGAPATCAPIASGEIDEVVRLAAAHIDELDTALGHLIESHSDAPAAAVGVAEAVDRAPSATTSVGSNPLDASAAGACWVAAKDSPLGLNGDLGSAQPLATTAALQERPLVHECLPGSSNSSAPSLCLKAVADAAGLHEHTQHMMGLNNGDARPAKLSAGSPRVFHAPHLAKQQRSAQQLTAQPLRTGETPRTLLPRKGTPEPSAQVAHYIDEWPAQRQRPPSSSSNAPGERRAIPHGHIAAQDSRKHQSFGTGARPPQNSHTPPSCALCGNPSWPLLPATPKMPLTPANPVCAA